MKITLKNTSFETLKENETNFGTKFANVTFSNSAMKDTIEHYTSTIKTMAIRQNWLKDFSDIFEMIIEENQITIIGESDEDEKISYVINRI